MILKTKMDPEIAQAFMKQRDIVVDKSILMEGDVDKITLEEMKEEMGKLTRGLGALDSKQYPIFTARVRRRLEKLKSSGTTIDDPVSYMVHYGVAANEEYFENIKDYILVMEQFLLSKYMQTFITEVISVLDESDHELFVDPMGPWGVMKDMSTKVSSSMMIILRFMNGDISKVIEDVKYKTHRNTEKILLDARDKWKEIYGELEKVYDDLKSNEDDVVSRIVTSGERLTLETFTELVKYTIHYVADERKMKTLYEKAHTEFEKLGGYEYKITETATPIFSTYLFHEKVFTEIMSDADYYLEDIRSISTMSISQLEGLLTVEALANQEDGGMYGIKDLGNVVREAMYVVVEAEAYGSREDLLVLFENGRPKGVTLK